MTRSIVLRYDATCHDCGNSLSAGTTARWFGRGRVSCCGGDDAAPRKPLAARPTMGDAAAAPAANRVEIQRAVDAAENDVEQKHVQDRARLDPLAAANHFADARGYCNGFAKQELLRSHYVKAFLAACEDLPPAPVPDAEIEEGLQQGLSPELLTRVAASQPTTRLLVRLQSGARLIVPAEHAAHVIRCIEESCIDKVRDVMRAAR